MTAPRVEKLRQFIQDLDALHRQFTDEATLLDAVAVRLASLVQKDDWLPEEYTLPHPHHYQQYLLHVDSGQRFSIVSFVWGPGAIDAYPRPSGMGGHRYVARRGGKSALSTRRARFTDRQWSC